MFKHTECLRREHEESMRLTEQRANPEEKKKRKVKKNQLNGLMNVEELYYIDMTEFYYFVFVFDFEQSDDQSDPFTFCCLVLNKRERTSEYYILRISRQR